MARQPPRRDVMCDAWCRRCRRPTRRRLLGAGAALASLVLGAPLAAKEALPERGLSPPAGSGRAAARQQPLCDGRSTARDLVAAHQLPAGAAPAGNGAVLRRFARGARTGVRPGPGDLFVVRVAGNVVTPKGWPAWNMACAFGRAAGDGAGPQQLRRSFGGGVGGAAAGAVAGPPASAGRGHSPGGGAGRPARPGALHAAATKAICATASGPATRRSAFWHRRSRACAAGGGRCIRWKRAASRWSSHFHLSSLLRGCAVVRCAPCAIFTMIETCC